MPDESRWLEPYTPAWYHQFARLYPEEAQIIDAQLSYAGGINCCCFCGDYWRVADYWVLGEQGEWHSLRLCDQDAHDLSKRGHQLILHSRPLRP